METRLHRASILQLALLSLLFLGCMSNMGGVQIWNPEDVFRDCPDAGSDHPSYPISLTPDEVPEGYELARTFVDTRPAKVGEHRPPDSLVQFWKGTENRWILAWFKIREERINLQGTMRTSPGGWWERTELSLPHYHCELMVGRTGDGKHFERATSEILEDSKVAAQVVKATREKLLTAKGKEVDPSRFRSSRDE